MRTYSRSILVLCLFGLAFGIVPGLHGQMVTGMSDIAIQCIGCGVDSYSLTELDYNASVWYDARADGFLSRGGSIVSSRTYAYGNPYVNFYLSTPLVYNTNFQIQTNHWIRAYYEVYVTEYGGYRYADPYGFSMISTGNYGGSAGIEPTYQYSYITSQDIYVGATYVGFSSPSPVINGIDVIGTPTRGSSGYVAIYGSYFGGLQSVTVDGTGVSVSTTYESDTQVNISYTIAANATTGDHNLRLTTIFGPSNPAAFRVYDPTPSISSISPSTWQAGTTTSFTISGSGFGSSPGLSISAAGVTSYGITNSSDTQIAGTVTIAADAPQQNANVTVTATGYGGNQFIPAPGGGSSSQASGTVAIAAASYAVTVRNASSVVSNGSTQYITADPEMPAISAVAQGPGSYSTQWSLTVQHTRPDGTGTNTDTFGPSTTTGPAAWIVPWSGHFRGGTATVNWTINGTHQGSLTFSIAGMNPTNAAINNQINSQNPPWFFRRMVTAESSYRQFDSSGQPLFTNDKGYGLTQVTTSNAQDLWNWKGNITAGLATISSKRSPAYVFWQNQIDEWQRFNSGVSEEKRLGPPPDNNAGGPCLFAHPVRPGTYGYDDANWIKAYNGASQYFAYILVDLEEGTARWETNKDPANYVHRVCQAPEL